MIKILFVCLSNICRSPILQAVLQKKINKLSLEKNFFIDSCGIGYWHVGKNSDQRAIRAAKEKGYKLVHTAKLFHNKYFKKFDYILAVDCEIVSSLKELAKNQKELSKIYLATDFVEELKGKEILDPYLQDLKAFDALVLLAEKISDGIISKLCV